MVTTWRFSEPNGSKREGWFVAFIDSTGCLAVLSDYGDYSYRWSAPRGTGCEFRAFLISCGHDYILGKIAGRDTFDADATEQLVKETILGLRRGGSISKERAREEWDIFEHHRPTNDFEFGDWMRQTEIADAWEMAVHGPSGQAKAFMDRVWPRIIAHVRASLEECPTSPPTADARKVE